MFARRLARARRSRTLHAAPRRNRAGLGVAPSKRRRVGVSRAVERAASRRQRSPADADTRRAADVTRATARLRIMHLLVLGGTVFLGRHVVNEALTRGHEVTIFSRGLHGTSPRRRARQRRPQGPRRRSPAPYDAVIDTSGYHPDDVAKPRSSTSATTSSSPPATSIPTGPTSPSTRTRPSTSPARATASTRRRPSASSPRAPRRCGPGLIVGPHDNVFRPPVVGPAHRGGRPGSRARGPRPADADHRRARPRELPARPRRDRRPAAPSTAPPRSARPR